MRTPFGPATLLLCVVATVALGRSAPLDRMAAVLDTRAAELADDPTGSRALRRVNRARALLARDSDSLLRDIRTARRVARLVARHDDAGAALRTGLDALAAELAVEVVDDFDLRELWLRHGAARRAARATAVDRRVDRARAVLAAHFDDPSRGVRLRGLERAARRLNRTEAFYFRRAALTLADALSDSAAQIDDVRIAEGSGIVWLGGYYWTHDDSGADAVLYRSRTPDFRAALQLPVPSAVNVDWEDLAVLGDDLLVCDIGDNDRERAELSLYQVRDAGASLELVATHAFVYEDGTHDAEAVAVLDGRAYVITKRDDADADAGVYVVDLSVPAADYTAVRVADLDLPAGVFVTAADVHAPTRSFVLLAYGAVLLFPPEVPSGAPSDLVLLNGLQSEALCLRGETLIVTNEQRDVFLAPRFIERVAAERP